MRAIACCLPLFGGIAVVRSDNGSLTNAERPRTIQAAIDSGRGIVVKQSALRPEGSFATNTAVFGTNAVMLVPSATIKAKQFGQYYKAPVNAVEGHWLGLLQHRPYTNKQVGSVLLQLKLHQP